MHKFLLVVLMGSLCSVAQAQPILLASDAQIFSAKYQLLQKDSLAPVATRITRVAQSFIGTPYQAHTLETSPNEKLIINMRGVDCTTFVETVLALTLTTKPTDSPNAQRTDKAMAAYSSLLQRIRYRHDTASSYPERLHYLLDWLYENQRKDILKIITNQLGGKPYVKLIHFMTEHRTAYQQLRNEAFFQEMLAVEANINRRTHTFIPKTAVKQIEAQLADGDIIAITSTLKTLDIVHVGFVVFKNSRPYLLHASSDAGKVTVSTKPLADYLVANKGQSGIMVARVNQ